MTTQIWLMVPFMVALKVPFMVHLGCHLRPVGCVRGFPRRSHLFLLPSAPRSERNVIMFPPTFFLLASRVDTMAKVSRFPVKRSSAARRSSDTTHPAQLFGGPSSEAAGELAGRLWGWARWSGLLADFQLVF